MAQGQYLAFLRKGLDDTEKVAHVSVQTSDDLRHGVVKNTAGISGHMRAYAGMAEIAYDNL